jgi:hypothetical protein
MCGGGLIDDGRHQDCQECDYSAPTGSHDLMPEISLERESKEHFGLKERASRWLKKRGFDVETEVGCRLSRAVKIRPERGAQKYIIIDVVGLKRGRPLVAVECESCKPLTLEVLACKFKEVWRLKHGAKSEPERFMPLRRYKSLRLVYRVDVPNPAAGW